MARLGVLSGGGLFTAGVWQAIDVPAGLMTGGMLLVAYCLLLTDVDGGKT
jgi:uncharacterized membrane protein AbrB (regulator of aidB expression)